MDPDSDTILVRVKSCAEARVQLLVSKYDDNGGLYQIVFGADNNTKITLG